MAILTITNLTAEPLLLQELYTTVGPGASIVTTRFHDDLHSIPRIQALWAAGKISVTVGTPNSEGDFIVQKVGHDGIGGPNGPVDLLASSVRHIQIATATSLKQGQGALTPDVVYKGNLVYMEFNQTTDIAFYLWKIGREFKDTAAIHIHWTKTQDINESGHTARWRIDYTAYTSTPSTAGNAAVTGVFVDTGDLVYVGGDANTDRLVYRTPDLPIVATGGQYVAVKISSPAPSAGISVTSPGLVSCDLTYNAYINKPT